MSPPKIVLLIVSIVVVSLTVSMCAYILSSYGIDFETIVSVAGLAANIATALALVFLGVEMINGTRSRNFDGATRLFDLLNTEGARKGRRLIYNAFLDKREWGEDEIKWAEKIRADLDQVGVMVREGLFPKKIALRMYSGVAIQCWRALEGHVKEQRKLRGTPYWMIEFEWFYHESVKYRKKEFPDENLRLCRME